MRSFEHLSRIRGHTIWAETLGPDSIVVDAGAHRGEFSHILTNAYGCKCCLVEANPDLAAALRVTNAYAVVFAALSVRDGHVPFVVRQNLESGSIDQRINDLASTNTVSVESISLPSLIKRHKLPRIDLLKLDIEGAEFDLIAETSDAVLQSIRQITVEFHDFLPVFRGRRLFEMARSRLRKLGFICCLISFRTHGDVLFLNQRHFQFGPATALMLAAGARWYLRLTERKRVSFILPKMK